MIRSQLTVTVLDFIHEMSELSWSDIFKERLRWCSCTKVKLIRFVGDPLFTQPKSVQDLRWLQDAGSQQEVRPVALLLSEDITLFKCLWVC